MVSVVGIGSYDSAALAVDFRKRHDLKSVRAIYDAGAKSRCPFKVVSQPAAVLVSSDGKILARYTGTIDYDEVLEKI